MKVHPLGSITAKLFYLTVALVMGTVGLFATRNALDLEKLLKAQLKDRSLNDTSISGRAIQAILDNWELQLGTLLQATLQTENKKVQSEQLKAFLSSREDFLATNIFKKTGTKIEEISFAFTGNVTSNRFGEAKPENIQKAIRQFNDDQKAKNFEVVGSRFVESLAGSAVTGLPILNIGKSFRIKGDKSTYLVVLTTWQAPIVESLVESQIISNFVVNRKGEVVSSRQFQETTTAKSYHKYGLVKKALKSEDPIGFVDRYTSGKKGKEFLGAYYRIPRFDLIVVAQQDRKIAYADINESILTAVKWGCLFLLFAVLLSFYGAEEVTKKLKLVTLATQRISQGEFDTRLGLRSNDEVGVLSLSVDIMAQRIQILLRDQLRQAETKKDLEMAQAVQETLFPKPGRTPNILRVAGYSIPASETGGDWWGHYSTGDGVEYVFVADAMGHGVPAALVTAVAYSSCMTLANMLSDTSQIFTPGQILSHVNRVLYNAVEGTISMTFFALMIDYHTGQITYANAGHNFPVLIPANPDDSRIKKKVKSLNAISPLSPVSMSCNGTILGVEKDVIFQEKTMKLAPGDKFFLFTDGLIECKSPEGTMWGRKVLLEKIMAYVELDPEGMKERIVSDAFSFFQNVPRDDDLTVVVVEFPKDAKIGGYRDDSVVVAKKLKTVGGIPLAEVSAQKPQTTQVQGANDSGGVHNSAFHDESSETRASVSVESETSGSMLPSHQDVGNSSSSGQSEIASMDTLRSADEPSNDEVKSQQQSEIVPDRDSDNGAEVSHREVPWEPSAEVMQRDTPNFSEQLKETAQIFEATASHVPMPPSVPNPFERLENMGALTDETLAGKPKESHVIAFDPEAEQYHIQSSPNPTVPTFDDAQPQDEERDDFDSSIFILGA